MKWEYIIVVRSRGYTVENGFLKPTDWRDWISKIGYDPVEFTDRFVDVINSLGEVGWELVGVSPRSGFGGFHQTTGFVATGLITGTSGSTQGFNSDFAGFTSEEVWSFKRQVT